VRREGAGALVALALLLTGCETTAEKSARLAKLARHQTSAQRGLSIAHPNAAVELRSSAVLHDENGTAAVLVLRNRARAPLRNVPIAITVKDAHGSTLYTNNTPGLSPSLVSVPLLLPGRDTVWIDDQIQVSGAASVSATAGEAPTASGPAPELSPQAVHLFNDPASGVGAEGVLANHSAVTQRELVVFASATRAGHFVAAGRAVLPSVPASGSVPFRIFFIGNPQGGALHLSAPATTFP
jgi:hypothetical protein